MMRVEEFIKFFVDKDPVRISSFFYQNGINIAIGAGLLVFFCILRPNNGAIYHRRQKLFDKSKKFPKVGSGLFDWISPVWHTTEAEILSVCGLDAVMLLRFIKLITTYGLCIAAFGIATTITNYFANQNSKSNIKGGVNFLEFDLQNLSISDSTEAKGFIWSNVVFAYISLFMVGYLIYKNNVEFIKLRQEYFNSKEYQSSISSRSLIALHLPEHFQDQEILKNYINNLDLRYKVLQCSIVPKVAHLPELIQSYNSSIRELETVLTRYVNKNGQVKSSRPTHHLKGEGYFSRGDEVDSIDYYTKRIYELHAEIKELRDYASSLPSSNIAFLLFKNPFSAHVAMQELEKGVGSKLIETTNIPEFSLAPTSNDLIWDNAQFTKSQIRRRGFIFTAVFIAVLLGGIIPLAFIIALANTNYIRALVGDQNILKETAHKVLLEGFLSPILLISSMLIVQFILKKLSIYQGATTYSSVDRRLLSKYYSFLIINYLVFFNVLAVLPEVFAKIKLKSNEVDPNASFIKTFRDIVSDAGGGIAKGIIKTSGFWANQLSIKSLSYMFELIQVISLVRRNIQKYFLRYSARDLKEFSQPQPFEYSVIYAMQCFNFSIILLFCTPAPIVIPFGIVNSVIAYFVYKHQIMYVYQTQIETGGRLWKTAFNRIVAALILSQFFLLLVFLFINVTDAQWMSILPLPFVTLVASLVHQAWVDSKVTYIDWRSPYRNHFGDKDTRQHIDFNSQFNHPAFNQELLALEADPLVLSAVPEVEKVVKFTAQNSTKNSSKKYEDDFESGRTTPGSQISSNFHAAEHMPSNDSMIELLDRNSQPQKMTHL